MFFQKEQNALAFPMSAIHPALAQYFNHYPVTDAPFMHQQLQDWSLQRPLKGIRVLHHVPVVPNTVLKIACLIAAGAEVTVTNPSFMTANPRAVASLLAAGVRYVANIKDLIEEKFDIYFDCAAELYQALGAPRLGAIELTGSGDQFYRGQTLSFPVVSVDTTMTKQLETVLGCAESSHSALSQLVPGINPAEKSWIIFGFGKIGRGLAYFCIQHGTRVVVVDRCETQRLAAESLGIEAITPHDMAAVKHAVANADIVMTATGGKAIMDVYPREWFNGKILANLGVDDEYGPQFSPDEVLNHKEPINFTLNDPTPMRYIDPEFYIHNIAGLVIAQKLLSNGVHNLPPEIDLPIINRWCTYHSFSPATLSRWFVNHHSESYSRGIVEAFAQTHYPALPLSPEMIEHLLWLQDNTVMTSQSNAQSISRPANGEVQRCLSRLYCLTLLLDGSESSYLALTQSQAEDLVLSKDNFEQLSKLIQNLSADEYDCLKATCFITKLDRAIIIMALSEKTKGQIPADSEQFITYMTTHFPTLTPVTQLLTPAGNALLRHAFCANSHARHMLDMEGGYNMVSSLADMIRNHQITHNQYQLWFARWIINIAGLDGHIHYQGSSYLTNPVADSMVALKLELDQLWNKSDHPVVDNFLKFKTKQLHVNSPYAAYLGALMRLNPNRGPEVQAWFDTLSPQQQSDRLKTFQQQLEQTKVTPTYKPTVLTTLLAMGCSIAETSTLFTDIESEAMQIYLAAVAEEHIPKNTPLSFRKVAFKDTLLVPIKEYYRVHNQLPELSIESDGSLTVTSESLRNELSRLSSGISLR